MNKLISKETESDLLKLGVYQFIGGAVGIVILLLNLFKGYTFHIIGLLIYFLVLLFFSYSIFCAVLCLKTSEKALQHSLANQILQLVGFAAMGFGFKYVSGIYLTIGLDLTESLKVDAGAGLSKFIGNFNMDKDRLELDINLFAIGIVYWIDRLMKRVKEERLLRQVNDPLI